MSDTEHLVARIGWIEEELDEMMEEVMNGSKWGPLRADQIDKAKLTKEMADLIYVICGMAVAFGLPLDEVFDEVHKSNMTKTGSKRGDGKVTKGPDYVAPNLDKFFKEPQ